MEYKKTTNNQSIGIHFFYVTLILSAMIIALATVKSTEQPRFTDYLSTAATITSLVLGLLAIIYAYISNDSLARTTGTLIDSVDESKEASTKLTAVIQTVDTVANSSAESSKSLSNLISSLTREISELSGTAKSLEQSTQNMASILPSIPEEIGALGKKFDEFYAQNGTPQGRDGDKNAVSDEARNEISRSLIAGSSAWGYLLMHACYLSKSREKSFEFSSKVFNVGEIDYFFGFFICLSSCGLVGTKPVKPKERIREITRCPEVFSQAKEKYLEKCAKLKSDSVRLTWVGALENLEKFFAQEDEKE